MSDGFFDRLDWTVKLDLYRDKYDAERAAVAAAQKTGERVVYDPVYDEEYKAWIVSVWTPPKKRASRPKQSGRSAGGRGRS